MDREKVLSLECDILVTAAMECAIDENNAGEIKASIIAEAANLPISFEADEILEGKRATVLPDILTNAGASICSYFEWKHNLHSEFTQGWTPDIELFNRLTQAYEDVRRYASAENISLKKAAYAIALERIAAEEAKHNSL
jgi:glutamate dehydrogenase/leucine dehydrogenase